jgi:RNA polymerase sigma-70 factor (sigma-E family)
VVIAPTGPDAVSIPLGEFARANAVALVRFAYLMCGDRGVAEDLVQDAFLALYRRFGETIPVAAPVAYARRTIVNAQLSRARRRSSTERLLADLPDVATDAVFPDEQDAMWRALATVPDRQRAVLVLRYYLDLPDREIAGLLGASEGTVRSLAARAFAVLRGHPALDPASAKEQP